MRTASRPDRLSLPRHRRRAGALVATAALCLAAQLLGLVHLVVVRHATCLAHDELVHTSAPAREDVAAAVVGSGARAAAVPADAAEHADDHCLVVASRRRDDATLSTPAVRLPPAAPPAALLCFVPADRGTSAVPLLHLAPKSSPPRAAVPA